MGFRKVKILNFRNLQNKTIDLSARKNIFLVGPNGQGKTNFLELIYFLCFGSSFRAKQDSILTRIGENNFYCGSEYEDSLNIINRTDIKFSNKKKEIKINKKNIIDRKELIYQIPCIVFCHEDIHFVNGQPERKRWFFDQTLSLKYPFYLDNLRKFKNILKQRNYILKNKKKDLWEIYSVQLVKTGLELQKRREEVILWFNRYLKDYFSEISELDDVFKLEYNPSWKGISTEKEAYQLLESKKNSEFEKGISLIGPHRDNYGFFLGDNNFLEIASTGQMRLVSLLLRVIQAKYFAFESSKKPVLLLDDVLLELDREKRSKFLKMLPEYDQAFFTFLPGDDTYGDWESSLNLSVSQGNIE